jgi:hypothetical protein
VRRERFRLAGAWDRSPELVQFQADTAPSVSLPRMERPGVHGNSRPSLAWMTPIPGQDRAGILGCCQVRGRLCLRGRRCTRALYEQGHPAGRRWLSPVIPATQDRDQKDCGLKPARANSLRDPNSKKSIQKKGWWSGSRCRP